MIQFNLLPDVKINYVKARRTKRLVLLTAIAVTGLALFIMILLFLVVNFFQKTHMSNLDEDIKQGISDLKAEPSLEKKLTVQNQAGTLDSLHEEKPAAQRINDILIQITPADAKIASVEVSFEESTISLSGSAKNIQIINQFVDTIKFTKYKSGEELKDAFNEVVLDSFDVGEDSNSGEGSTYSISTKFDPEIFNNTVGLELQVPKIVSTRSITEKPDIFEKKVEESTEEGQQ